MDGSIDGQIGTCIDGAGTSGYGMASQCVLHCLRLDEYHGSHPDPCRRRPMQVQKGQVTLE